MRKNDLSLNANLKQHFRLIGFVLLTILLISGLLFPFAISTLGVIFLLFTFSTAIAFIIEKLKGHELMRRKIAMDISILTITLLLAVLLGGIVSQFAANVAGAYVEVRWQGAGMAAGFIAAILASFAVGYAVNRAAGKLSRK
jgi:hypothetical protein